MYNTFEYEPWKVARDPRDKHMFPVICCEDIRRREIINGVWTDITQAQAFADAANELYNTGRKQTDGEGVSAA